MLALFLQLLYFLLAEQSMLEGIPASRLGKKSRRSSSRAELDSVFWLDLGTTDGRKSCAKGLETPKRPVEAP
jgi:hypothetical protein